MWTKLHAWRSFVVTAPIPKNSFVRALYWDTSEPYNYVRCTNYNDTHDILIVGGADRKTGQIPDYEEPYQNLEAWARQRWLDMGPVMQRWSG
jgi:glycine/D-amino acid oxidase-like deaminating enzyme